MEKKRYVATHRADSVITLLVLSLIAVGLIMLYSTGWITIMKQTGGASDQNSFFIGQLISFGAGIIGWIVASRVPYTTWQKNAKYIFYGSVVLMLMVLIPSIAVSVNGATRWIRIGFINFQPVEFFKLGMVLFVAAYLEKNRAKLGNVVEGIIPFVVIIAIAALSAVVLQKDMGSASIVIGSAMIMYFASGVPMRAFLTVLGGLVAAMVTLIATSSYRLARYLTFLNHSEDPSGAGYHINQALIALGSGGLLGHGLGKSLQAYGYLPEATNDSIFAIIGEEFGFVGCSIIIGLYALFIYRGIQIARYSPDNFSRLVALGITSWIGLQAILNISAMVGLIPLTGIPIPFISYGGTSLVALLFAVGILQNISRYTRKEELNENSDSRRRNSWSRNPVTSNQR